MAKQDFDLNKKSKRNFDLEKKKKHEFDLSKNNEELIDQTVSEPQSAKETQPPANNFSKEETQTTNEVRPDAVIPPEHFENVEDGNVRKTKWWIYICGCAILVGLVIWLFCEMDWKAKHQGEMPLAETENVANTVPEDNEYQTQTPVNQESSESNIANTEEETTVAVPDQPSEGQSNVSPDLEPSEQKSVTENSVLPSSNVDVEKEAWNVIAGKYGNGEERRRKLGSYYKDIQSRVNEKKRNGEF